MLASILQNQMPHTGPKDPASTPMKPSNADTWDIGQIHTHQKGPVQHVDNRDTGRWTVQRENSLFLAQWPQIPNSVLAEDPIPVFLVGD
jgi:hypothetical protein